MRTTSATLRTLGRIPSLLDALPTDIFFDVDSDGGLNFQAASQGEVLSVRRCFPGVFWHKEWSEGCRWWEYNAEYVGIKLHIYACREAPPSCKAIITTVEVEEQVPVAYETRRVKKEVITWDCSNSETRL